MGFCLESQEQVAGIALCSTLSPSTGGSEEEHGMEIKPLQRTPPGPGAREENLSWAPGKKSEGVKTDPTNILLLMPLCCSPPVQQDHLLACLQSSLSQGGTAGCL